MDGFPGPWIRQAAGTAGAVQTGAGLAIWFDRSTGLVGSSQTITASSDTSNQLGTAVFDCDVELVYRSSLDAYIEADPEGGELGPNGLPVDRGERLTFGDPSVLTRLTG